MVRKSINNYVSPPNRTNYLSEKWFNKIKGFQVLVVYDEDNHKNLSKDINMDWGELENTDLFQGNTDSDTFVICEQTYQQNKKLFLKLRINARNELILRMAKVIIVYLLKKYETYYSISLHEQKQFKNPQFMYSLINQFEDTLKRRTFLADNHVWDEFCEWFNVYLSDWVLQDMENTIGINRLEKMSEKEIKKLFNTYITDNLSEDSRFMFNFKKIVNRYVQQWITRIIAELNLDGMPIQQIEELFEIERVSSHVTNKNITMTVIQNGSIQVMSNPVYQSMRESISNCAFIEAEYAPWPTAILDKGSMKGTVQIKPHIFQRKDSQDRGIKNDRSWNLALELSEVDVDVYDALCSLFLSKAKHHKDTVKLYVKDLLMMRGLKAKLGAEGRRGGFESKQRNQIMQALSILQSLWVEIEKITLYEQRKPVQRSLKGRVYLFKDEQGEEVDIMTHPFNKCFYLSLGDVLSKFLNGSGRQIALLPIQALHYDPYRQKWEKKLTRYLSWRWRTQARKGSYLQPHKIITLLDVLGFSINERTPSRTRERLEKAMDQLLEDGIVASWQYENWDEEVASTNGWSRIWLHSTLVIEPPLTIREQYRSIERNSDKKSTTKHEEDVNRDTLGHKLKNLRNKLDLTLQQAAEEMEISASYLSNIERGVKRPSVRITYRMEEWIQRYYKKNIIGYD